MSLTRHVAAALLVSSIAGAASPATVSAQGAAPARDLTHASMEDLMNITITSAARKEQRAEDVAGAVYVITQEDIRRSGMTTLPDLLRLVPGVQVAQINANKSAVSVRGFNSLHSNKLLVLVDGRSVYNRMFSGVMWDSEEVMLDDIERIEVVRGPGGAVWGANAVNGVINIVTRSAAETKGALVRLGGGTLAHAQTAVRYGGSLANIDYRVYSQWSSHGESQLTPGVLADDQWRTATVGFRSDWSDAAHGFTLEGNVTRGRINALWLNTDPAPSSPNRPLSIDAPSDLSGGMVLGRWTRTRGNGASMQLQSVFDVAHRDEPVGDYHRRTVDVDFQYRRPAGRHDVVAGAGYRMTHEQFAGRLGYALVPEIDDGELLKVFAQDEIALTARLHATVGGRVEDDGLAGWGVQPTARVTWEFASRQHLWLATSRALRTPSLTDRGIRIEMPPVLGAGPLPIRFSVSGSPEARTEELADAEAGYKFDVGSVATVAVTSFYGRYHHLQTSEPGDPRVIARPGGAYVSVPVRLESLLGADTRGVEIDAHWTPVLSWRLDASYSAFHLMPHPDAASRDATAATFDGNAAGAQWQVHSGWSMTSHADFDATLFHVGALKAMGVAAYTRADGRVQVPLRSGLALSVIGQNLLDPTHAEFAGTRSFVTPTLVPRSVRAQLVWRF